MDRNDDPLPASGHDEDMVTALNPDQAPMPALCPKPVSQGQFDDAVILCYSGIRGIHREPQFDGLS
jgi:hypothetical protein